MVDIVHGSYSTFKCALRFKLPVRCVEYREVRMCMPVNVHVCVTFVLKRGWWHCCELLILLIVLAC